MRAKTWLQLCGLAVLFGLLSCGGTSGTSPTTTNSPAAPPPGVPSANSVACNCTASEPSSTDYRHDAKHQPLPSTTGQDITVADILGWTVGSDPDFHAPRSGIENQVFHIAQAYVQFIWLVPNDCDIHMEVSNVPDKAAPRIIVETPIDSEYCPTREAEVSGFSRYGAQVTNGGFETAQGIPVDIVGMAFRDFNHERGTKYVASPWELHPAIVTVK
jgi:hypothetical protein